MLEHSNDERIKRDIVEHLRWDERVDASQVRVTVVQGQVELQGTVPSFFVRMAAGYDAWAIRGVKRVDNQLEVAAPAATAVPTDEKVRTRILDALLWNPNIDVGRIEVAVEAGRVTVGGVVDAYWKKPRITELISEIMGVVSVDDRLRVIPRRRLADRDIEESIRSAVARSGAADPESLSISAREGVVRLTGRLKDRSAYVAVENAARHTSGVTGIIDELTIMP